MIETREIKDNIYRVDWHMVGFNSPMNTNRTTFYYDFKRGMISELDTFPYGVETRTLTKSDRVKFDRLYRPKLISTYRDHLNLCHNRGIK